MAYNSASFSLGSITHDGALVKVDEGAYKTVGDGNEIHSLPFKLKLAKTDSDNLCFEVAGGAKFGGHVQFAGSSTLDIDQSTQFGADIELDKASGQIIQHQTQDLTIQASGSGKKLKLFGGDSVEVENWVFADDAITLANDATMTAASGKSLTLSAGSKVVVEDLEFNGAALTFASEDAVITAAAGKKIDVVANAASSWSTSAGLLTIDGKAGLILQSPASGGESVQIYAATAGKKVYIGDSDTVSVQIDGNAVADVASVTAKAAGDLTLQGASDQQLLFKVQEGTGSAATALSIAKDGDALFAGDVTFSGNITVNGVTSTVNSTTITVDDKNIELGSVDNPTDTTANGGGITLKGAADKTIAWSSTSTRWHYNQGIEIDAGSNAGERKLVLKDTLDADDSSTAVAAVEVSGGLLLAKKFIHQDVTDASRTAAAMKVAGGALITKKLIVLDTTDASSSGAGIEAVGGLLVGEKSYLSKEVTIASATEAGSSAAALDVIGGAKIGKKLIVSGSDSLAVSSSGQTAALEFGSGWGSGDFGLGGIFKAGWDSQKASAQFELKANGNLTRRPPSTVSDFQSRGNAGNAMMAELREMAVPSGAQAVVAGEVVLGKVVTDSSSNYSSLQCEGQPSSAAAYKLLGVATGAAAAGSMATFAVKGTIMCKLMAHGQGSANMLGTQRIGDEVFYIQTSNFKGMCAESDLPSMANMSSGSVMYRVGHIVGVAADLTPSNAGDPWDARVLLDMEKIIKIDS